MTSYFDHFIIIQIINPYITDSFIVIFFVIILYYFLSFNISIIPSRLQNIVEIIIEHWVLVIQENLGLKFKYYVLPLTTLFMFILGMNLLGFFLFTFPSTTHITITFGMAIIVWSGVMIFGFINFKSSFLSIFMPTGAPLGLSPLLVIIEIVSNVSRPVALGMRLAANLTAGHILLAILADFGCKLLFYSYSISNLFPIFIIIFMTGLEMGVLIIQAYVFCLLSMIYLKDSVELH
uniref:ATP synthase F0 subunit 6 n=1 Tax=Stephanomia amphytridis TaxID=645353 RepID=UPI0026E3FF69|nr:ATP synthase F0 subunit 6 [Stephanomia amphytridis]WJJ70198.1 ATP synthase F0 subunit 6 [Stephanomia amphytridis]